MQALTNALLDELGLGSIPQDEKDRMLADIEEALASQVGHRAEELLSEEKLDELDKLTDSGSGQEEINSWLGTNLANYQQIVDEELAKIKNEIKPQVEGIVASFSGDNSASSA